MRKLIYGGLFLALVGIAFMGCEKETKSNTTIDKAIQTENIINEVEIENILSSLNGNLKAPPWWEKFADWVQSKSGAAQRYQDGQKQCFGNGGCGPCAAICPFGIAFNNDGENGNLTDFELNNGFRSYRLALIEQAETGDLRIMLEFENHLTDFIEDGNVLISDSFYLSSDMVSSYKLNSVHIEAGNYPVFYNSETGFYQTILNTTIN